jgi:hypothetical protein
MYELMAGMSRGYWDNKFEEEWVMKFLRRRNIFLISASSVLLIVFAVFPASAQDSDQWVKDIDQSTKALNQDLQEKMALKLQQAVDTQIVLPYENLLAQQSSDYMEQVALVVSIEPDPVISIDPSEMMAQAVPLEVVPLEDDEDCAD